MKYVRRSQILSVRLRRDRLIVAIFGFRYRGPLQKQLGLSPHSTWWLCDFLEERRRMRNESDKGFISSKEEENGLPKGCKDSKRSAAFCRSAWRSCMVMEI